MRMSVLVVTYRRPNLLENCLCAIERQARLPDQVVVVGVAGDQVTAAVVQRFAATSSHPYVWQASPVPSVVKQTNLGLTACDGDIVVFTNDDAEPFPDWLARMEPYYADPTVGGVGGRDFIHLEDGRIWEGQADRVGQITWFGRVHGNQHLDYAKVEDVDVLKGVNMSCRRQLLRPLDVRMVGGGRWHWELDASLQVRQAGQRLVYDPHICVDHFHGSRPGALGPAFAYEANYNLVLNLAKRFGPWKRIAFLGYTFLWGDYPEMGLAVFLKTYLWRLASERDFAFGRLLGPCLRGKVNALCTLLKTKTPNERQLDGTYAT